MYATKDNCSDEKARSQFNCVQRAHQNSLENYPQFLAMLTLAGVKYPITAAAAGAIYLAGRIFYFQVSTAAEQSCLAVLWHGACCTLFNLNTWSMRAGTCCTSLYHSVYCIYMPCVRLP
jgi:uncharacterized MAPEG superfamily protein